MIKGSAHVALSVRDMEESLAFYRDLLGFKVVWDMDRRKDISKVVGLETAEARVAMLEGPGGRLELFQYYDPEGVSLAERMRQCDVGITHFALEVERLDEMYEHLRGKGVKFYGEPVILRGVVKVVYMKDPNGITIELIERIE